MKDKQMHLIPCKSGKRLWWTNWPGKTSLNLCPKLKCRALEICQNLVNLSPSLSFNGIYGFAALPGFNWVQKQETELSLKKLFTVFPAG